MIVSVLKSRKIINRPDHPKERICSALFSHNYVVIELNERKKNSFRANYISTFLKTKETFEIEVLIVRVTERLDFVYSFMACRHFYAFQVQR